jgi:hypothetical protein
MRDRRDDVIRHHVDMAARHSGETIESIAARAVELYEARTPLHARHIPFMPRGRNPYEAQRANALHVRRFLGLSQPGTRMPVEFEEALVLALPEPFRTECLRELADRLGLLAAKAPDPAASLLCAPADLMRECAEVITALAPALVDGTYTADDLPAIRAAVGALADVQGATASLLAQLADAQQRLGVAGTAPVVRLRRAAAGEVDPS